MSTRHRIAVLVVAAALVAASAPTAHSQILAGLSLERLGALSTSGTGARPFAMGGAYMAAGNDVFALLANPAGLAEMREGQISVGLDHTRDKITNTYLGIRDEQTGTHTALGDVAAGYPLPNYRSNLAVGFGVFRVGSSNLETVKSGYLSGIPATVENRFIGTGTIYQYALGFGVDVSPSVSFGASLLLWDESIDTEERIDYADPDSTVFWTDDVSLDLDGVSFNIGLLVRVNDVARAGFAFTSPAWLNYRGAGTTTETGTYPGGGGFSVEPFEALIDDDYTLPVRFSGGLSIDLSPVTIAGDVSYCDFSQTEYNGLTITSEIDRGLKRVLDETWDVRAGAELAIPGAPVWLRAGFSYVPLALASIEEIAYISRDEAVSIIGDVDVTRNRKSFTFGAGGTIDQVLTLDAGVALGGYERVTKSGSTTVLEEKRSTAEVVLTGTYRF